MQYSHVKRKTYAPEKKAIVLALGCPENRLDSARILEFFKRNGYISTSEIRVADIVIVNTCALTEIAEEKSMNVIRRIHRFKKKNAIVLICGCLVKIKGDIKEFEGVSKFGLDDDLERLDDYFFVNDKFKKCHANYLISSYYSHRFENDKSKSFNLNLCEYFRVKKISWSNLKVDFKKYGNFSSIFYLILINIFRIKRIQYHKANHVYGPDVFSIKISTGCPFKCSYCSVKLARGKLRSKPPAQVVEEFKIGLNTGFTKFGLLGTEVGSYGKEIHESLLGLLENIITAGEDREFEIRLRNIHPMWLINNLVDLRKVFGTGKITYMSIPIQSGSDRILNRMNRTYSVESFKHVIKTIRVNYPFIGLHTQIMLGFPGETEDDFYDTFNLLKDLKFKDIEVYNFSPRQGTLAAKMSNQVPFKISLQRAYKICRAFDHALRMG